MKPTKDIHISSAELNQMECLGRGACSNVYKYGDLAIKVLNDSGILLHNEEEFSNMIGIENGTCVFPKSRLFLDGEFKGYSMEYVQGRPVQEVIMDLNLRELIMAIRHVEEDLKLVSDRKILLNDFNQGGLMWDERNKRFKIIDTDFFEKNDNISEEQCYNKNLRTFNALIEMLLQIQNGQSNKVLQYLRDNKDYEATCHEYIKNEYVGNRPSVTVLIEKAIETFETNFGVHIDTMKDIGELVGEKFESKEVDLDNIPVFVPPENDVLQSGVYATETVGTGAINSAIDMIRNKQLYGEEKTGPKEKRL